MAVKNILLLGNPKLYMACEDIEREELIDIRRYTKDLRDTLNMFKRNNHSGRAISAPQIGINKNLIYMRVEGREIVMLNPRISFKNSEKTTIWDDCLCFPYIFVKLERYETCSVKYKDLNFEDREIEFTGELSYLMQHEYDHLRGIIALDRRLDDRSIKMLEIESV